MWSIYNQNSDTRPKIINTDKKISPEEEQLMDIIFKKGKPMQIHFVINNVAMNTYVHNSLISSLKCISASEIIALMV